MGHNIVIGKAEDMDGIFKDGAGAAATDYVKPDDARVVAHTKLVGGGEVISLTLDPAKWPARMTNSLVPSQVTVL